MRRLPPPELVSIVTLTYNKFGNLYRTIESVLNQDYPRIEYIVCDDGSDCFPEEDIRNFFKENARGNAGLTIIRNERNQGTVKNCNKAYKNATGKYILNLACGDVFTSEKVVTSIVDRFESTKANVLVTTRLLYKGDLQPICMLPHYKERKILSKLDTGLKQYKAFVLSKFYDAASGSAMYFRASLIREMGYFDENYVLWEDGPFLAKYLQQDKLEQAYDIISIWYETGGVSDNAMGVNPLLKKDNIKFSFEEKMQHLEYFSRYEKRMMTFRNKRLLLNSVQEKVLLYIMYCPEWISYLFYGIKRRIYMRYDLKKINCKFTCE